MDTADYIVVPIPPACGSKRTTLGRLYDTKNFGIDTVHRGPAAVKLQDKCQTPTCEAAWSILHATEGWRLCGNCAAEKRARTCAS